MIEQLIRTMAYVSILQSTGVLSKLPAEPDASKADFLSLLKSISSNISQIREVSFIHNEVETWINKIKTNYKICDELNTFDREEIKKVALKWAPQLVSIGSELDAKNKSLELIEERIKKIENAILPMPETIKKYISSVQNSTMAFVESSPTERSLEPILRGLLNNACSIGAEIMLTGYFDQYLLDAFEHTSPKTKVGLRPAHQPRGIVKTICPKEGTPASNYQLMDLAESFSFSFQGFSCLIMIFRFNVDHMNL